MDSTNWLHSVIFLKKYFGVERVSYFLEISLSFASLLFPSNIFLTVVIKIFWVSQAQFIQERILSQISILYYFIYMYYILYIF